MRSAQNIFPGYPYHQKPYHEESHIQMLRRIRKGVSQLKHAITANPHRGSNEEALRRIRTPLIRIGIVLKSLLEVKLGR